jgi:hypothetical protein
MSKETKTISLNELDKLKEAYSKAVENEDLLFTFDGEQILTTFAKYLIEHLENVKKEKI